MFSKPILTTFLLALVSTANAVTFRELIENEPQLSLFNALLNLDVAESFTDILRASVTNPRTILIPNNNAVQNFMQQNSITDLKEVKKDTVIPFLSYHVLARNITSRELLNPGGIIVQTNLRDEKYSLFDNGQSQVVYGKPAAVSTGGDMEKETHVEIESGLKKTVKVVQPDLQFDTGTVHIVDGLLTLPKTCSETIDNTGASLLVDLLTRLNLIDGLDSYPGATCFAPSDESIGAALPVLQKMTDQELTDAIKFHTLLDPFYTTNFTDGQTIPTQLGPNITVNIVGQNFYFNGVKAKTVNDIARNGVAYLLEGIMPIEFDGIIGGSNSTTSTTATMSSGPTSTMQSTTTGGSMSTTTTTGSPSSTETPSSAGVVRVGGSILVAAFAALLAAF